MVEGGILVKCQLQESQTCGCFVKCSSHPVMPHLQPWGLTILVDGFHDDRGAFLDGPHQHS